MKYGLMPLAVVLALSSIGCAPSGTDPSSSEEAADKRDDHLDGSSLYTLWVHGRNASGSTRVGDYQDFSYWGDASAARGKNPRAVNWDGRSRISESNGVIRRALDCFCTGERWCVIAAHSAGDAQIGYALAMFGGTEREVTDGAPSGDGTCGGTGKTQAGWNIRWVETAGGAGGGTELADLGYWAVSDPLTSDLRTSVVRSLYDHSATGGAVFYRFAGAKGTAYSAVLGGQDDEVIAYHSSGGLSAVGSFCNAGDWMCDGTLEYGANASYKGKKLVPKWGYHELAFRDDGEKYDHYTRGGWGGIVAPMVEDIAYYAE